MSAGAADLVRRVRMGLADGRWGPRSGDPLKYVVPGPEHLNHAIPKDNKLVDMGQGAGTMGDHHHRAIPLFEGLDRLQQSLLTILVKVGVRFVQDDQAGLPK